MPIYDLLIKGGMIFDGLRNPRFVGDVAIKDGVIVEMGRLQGTDATQVIDATGLHVAPGFIDTHTHYDSQLFWDPYCSHSSWHGVTSLVIGNCGFGFAPVSPELRDRAMLTMSRNEAIPIACMRAGMPWDWETFPEFLDSVERTPKAVNILPLVPINPLLISVLGFDRAKSGELPTAEEHKALRKVLTDAMDAGACGFSCQRFGEDSVQGDYDGTPMASDVLNSETMLELGRALAELDRGVIQYTHFEPRLAELLTDAHRAHIEELAAVSGRPLIWNELQIVPSAAEVLAWIQDCRARGLLIYAQGNINRSKDGIIFSLGDDSMAVTDISTDWRDATCGTTEDKKRKIADPAVRAKMQTGAMDPIFQSIFGDIGSWVVHETYVPEMQPFKQMKIREIAAEVGKENIDVLCDTMLADDLATRFRVPLSYNAGGRGEGPLREIFNDPFVVPGTSDGGAHMKQYAGGGYTTDLLLDVREFGLVSLEEMHWRLSSLPAHALGFQDRGSLCVGAPADIVVYDYEKLAVLPDKVLHDFPADEWRLVQPARGYRWVIVNGDIIIEDDVQTGATNAGELLRHGKGDDRRRRESTASV